MKSTLIQINKEDNVLITIVKRKKNEIVNYKDIQIKILEDIPQGHKIALKDIKKGEKIIKYGYPIGYSTKDIQKGEKVHTHNVKTTLNESVEYNYDEKKASSLIKKWKEENKVNEIPTINAFVRENDDVAIRNDIWIIPTVGCVNKVASTLENWTNKEIETIENIDKAIALTHPYGCSQMGEDHEMTRKILANLAKHPHAGGVLILGLGCENNTIKEFKKLLMPYNENRIKFLIAQEVEDEIAEAKILLKELINNASKDKREKVSISRLKIGMKCGGSDGLSGITANPLVGLVCDKMVSFNASVVLTEVPEMFGAENILMQRCINKEVFDKTVSLINNFKDYYKKHNQVVYENPSPGNKEGGITTLEDKSLGCVQKGGTACVSDVIDYGEVIEKQGLILLNGPGNDIVSTTVMSAAKVNLILFTTGRGTPLGAPVPTVKIATNENLANNKKNWIDFDASPLLSYEKEIIRDNLIDYIIELSNGNDTTKNEDNNYNEIAIFKNGVTL